LSERRYATIAGVGSHLPERRVPNSYFEDLVETNDEWIRDRTGIAARHFAADGENTSDLAGHAVRASLETAAIEPSAVDMLIVATLTPDRPLPSTAVMVQRKLGINCPAFDINAACSGFSYAMAIGTSMIESGSADTVVIVGAEILSRYLDMTDRSTCILFGDGAGAAVLTASAEPGILGNVVEADGEASELLTIEAGGTVEPASEESVRERRHFIRMPNGREVYKRAVLGMGEACKGLLEKSGYSPDDVSLLVPHQANARIMATVADRLGIPAERCALDVQEVGNTSAASIPIALDRAWRAGRIEPGSLVLLTSFGAGLAWGANLVRWTAAEPR
jgi:3-oxoacyl-[acyl-carrier-protein] synthase-3